MLTRIDSVHFTYPGGITALAGVSLDIQPGEKVAWVGPNGSGKTTLARHLNGLLSAPKGSVWVGDWRTQDHSVAVLARRVAYVFQNPAEQLFRQTIWGEVAFGPQNLGFSTEQVKNAVGQALDLTGLRDVSQENPRDLGFSGRKRVALASALAMQTPLLVLDEPTAGLDAWEKELLGHIITQLHSQRKTVIVITHDLDFAVENLDRFVLLYQGRVVLDAPAETFFQQPDWLGQYGLVAPQIVRLSQSLGWARPALQVSGLLDELSLD